jgi:hypothetical protein
MGCSPSLRWCWSKRPSLGRAFSWHTCTALSSSRSDCAWRALDSVSLTGSALALLYATPSRAKTARTGGHPETERARMKSTVKEQGPP